MERLQAHFRGLVQAMEAGAYRTGCLLGNLAGGPTPPPALNAGLRAGFDGWVDDLTDVLEEIGHPRPRASSLARGIVMAWEGAMLLMRRKLLPVRSTIGYDSESANPHFGGGNRRSQ